VAQHLRGGDPYEIHRIILRQRVDRSGVPPPFARAQSVSSSSRCSPAHSATSLSARVGRSPTSTSPLPIAITGISHTRRPLADRCLLSWSYGESQARATQAASCRLPAVQATQAVVGEEGRAQTGATRSDAARDARYARRAVVVGIPPLSSSASCLRVTTGPASARARSQGLRNIRSSPCFLGGRSH